METAPETLTGVQWVLFDAVGTLLFPKPEVSIAYQAAGRRFNCDLSVGEIKQRFGVAYRAHFGARAGNVTEASEYETWRRVVGDVFPEAKKPGELFEYLWDHFSLAANWELSTAAGPSIEELMRRGYQVGIASNLDRRLRTICAELRLPISDDRIFISTEVGYAKPDPAFYLAVQSRLNCGPSEILIAGDDPLHDYDAPLASGWRTFLLVTQSGIDHLRPCAGDWNRLLQSLL